MSTTTIPLQVRLALVARAGGRCQYPGCNKRVDVDFLTGRRSTAGVFAHIVADEPAGPRGDFARSKELAASIDNLMVLCRDCHHRVDVAEVAEHPEERLLAFKRDHEDRVERLLAVDGALRTRLLVLTAPVGGRPVRVDMNDIHRAALPWYPVGKPHVVDLASLTIRDHEPRYWTTLEEELTRHIREALRPAGEASVPWSVFALAPIPLLMVLGRELGDIAPASVFQKHRVPDTWCWQPGSGSEVGFDVHAPTVPCSSNEVALVLSVSGVVLRDAVAAAVGESTTVWEIAARAPDVHYVRAAAQLGEFSTVFRSTLSRIREATGPDVVVHLLPAVPNSVAVECGRRLLPKVDPRLVVYDYNHETQGFSRTLTLLPGPQRFGAPEAG